MNAITEGSHKSLPPQDTRVLVWGGHPSAARAAELWLQKRGLTTIDPATVRQMADQQQLRKDVQNHERDILHIGKLVRADMVVLVDTPFTKGETAAPYIGPSGGGMMERTVYLTSVTVKGVMVQSGETAWSGSARYPGSYDDLDQGLKELTCQALATAWGYRPAGHYPINARAMCDVGEPISR